MPAIWNIGNINQFNNKKLSSKLTFEEGEIFKGTVVGKDSEDDEGSVVVKLTNGWQFPAELLENFSLEEQRLVQFKVDSFENGKVKLKIIDDLKSSNEEVDEDVINNFIQKEGLSESDTDMLKAMIKFNIPLTKENIEQVKTMFNFSEKAKTKEGVEDFINKYIAGKNINPSSEEAANIKQALTEFFDAFKNMSDDEILLFFENGIDINKENIDSYNTLFKSDITLKEYFDNVAKDLEKLNLQDNKEFTLEESSVKDIETNKNETLEGKQAIKYSQMQSAGLRIYDDSSTSKSKVSLLNILRTITGNENNVLKDTVKNILLENKSEFQGLELNNLFAKLDNMPEEEVKNIFNNYLDNNTFTKESLEKALGDIIGKNIKISNNEYQEMKNILEFKDSEGTNQKTNNQESNLRDISVKNYETLKNNDPSMKDINLKVSKEASKVLENTKLISSDIAKNQMNEKTENIKDVIKEIMSKSNELQSRNLESKVAEFIKSNMNNFKLFNALSNEYYYMDVPVKMHENEYPCKLIIKDDRKENKKIDSNNVKMVVAVKTIHMDTVDAYLTVSGANLSVDIKCIDKFAKVLSAGKDKLSDKLSNLGYSVYISVSPKVEEVSLTSCRKFFDDGNISTLDTKV